MKVIKKPRPLTRKQAAFVKQLIDNPKQSATKAALQVYNATTDNSAAQIATDNLRNPQILMELAKYSGKAEMVVLEAMGAEKKEYRFNPDSKSIELVDTLPDHAIRLKAADSVLDRVHGKATQRIEQHTTGVTLNLDLTSSLAVSDD